MYVAPKPGSGEGSSRQQILAPQTKRGLDLGSVFPLRRQDDNRTPSTTRRRRRPLSPGRYFGIVLLLSLPGLAPVGILTVLEFLPVLPATVAALMVFSGAAAIGLLYFRDATDIADYLDILAEDGETRPPRPKSELGRALVNAVSRLTRYWRNRERSLALQLEAIDGMVEALPDPLIVVDRERSIIRANEAAETLFGTRPVGRDMAEVLRVPQVLTAVDDVLRGGRPHTVEFSRPVPIEQVFEARVKPYGEAPSDEPSLPLGAPAALLTLHDITAIKRSEQMRADFVANASHELRTPLSTLIGFIETLRGPAREDVDARERFLGIMEEQAGRMSRLINDLLSLSKIELDEHTAPVGKVEIGGLLGSVIDLLQIKAAHRGMTLTLQLDDNLPMVIGDADQLMQVFQNLVDNAIKYGSPDTEVAIAARANEGARGQGTVVVAIRDCGEGIPKGHLPRLTERFYRVDPARSRALGGTGLGLAIVKHIVSRHRGRLMIESDVSRGSVFSVALPAARQRPPQPVISEEPARSATG